MIENPRFRLIHFLEHDLAFPDPKRHHLFNPRVGDFVEVNEGKGLRFIVAYKEKVLIRHIDWPRGRYEVYGRDIDTLEPILEGDPTAAISLDPTVKIFRESTSKLFFGSLGDHDRGELVVCRWSGGLFDQFSLNCDFTINHLEINPLEQEGGSAFVLILVFGLEYECELVAYSTAKMAIIWRIRLPGGNYSAFVEMVGDLILYGVTRGAIRGDGQGPLPNFSGVIRIDRETGEAHKTDLGRVHTWMMASPDGIVFPLEGTKKMVCVSEVDEADQRAECG